MPAYIPRVDFSPGTVTAEYITDYLKQLKEASEARRREEIELLRDFHEGGKFTAQGKYVRQSYREDEDAWLGRLKRLITVNICKPVVRAVTTAMYGCPVHRNVTARKGSGVKGTVGKKQDEKLHRLMKDANYSVVMKETATRASVFGTHVVGPWYNARTSRVGFRTRDISSAYPFPNAWDGQTLDMILFETLVEPFEEDDYDRVEIWTPWEVGIFRNARVGEPRFYPDPAAAEIGMSENPTENPYGCIPWEAFRAEPDLDEGNWFGMSDIRDVAEANNAINQWLSILDMNIHDQGWSQMVLIGYPGDAAELVVGTQRAISIPVEGGDAKFIHPDLQTGEILDLIDKIQRFANESANVPLQAIRTYGEAQSGVSLELKMKPLLDMVKDRRERYEPSESRLLEMAMLVDEVHRTGKTFTPDEAQAWFDRWETTVRWRDDLMPHDTKEEINRDKTLFDMKVVDLDVLVQKYNPLYGKTPEERRKEIYEMYQKYEEDAAREAAAKLQQSQATQG